MGSILIYQNDKLLKVHDLSAAGAIAIGRHPLNDIHLPDPTRQISRFHVAIFQDAGGHSFLQDLGSRNGVFVNGRKQAYGPLNDGDSFVVGDYTLLLQTRKEKGRVNPEVILTDEGPEEFETTTVSSVVSDRAERDYSKLDHDLLVTLHKMSLLVNKPAELEESLQLILKEVAGVLNPERILVALFRPDGSSLNCLAQHPLDKTAMQMSRTAIERIRHDKTALLLNPSSINESQGRKAHPAARTGARSRSALSMPLVWGGEARGLLHMDLNSEKAIHSEKEKAFLSIIARDLAVYIEKGLNYRELKQTCNSLEQRFEAQKCIVGISEKTKSIRKAVEKLAVTDATVLITGETGTGKDLVAEVIHSSSRRKGRPFIQVNCAAIPENLLESEMFGVIANYPGLHNREALKGKFELAQGGTVFLNEIGEMPQRLQAKLLDALEKKVIWPLGRNQPLAVDVRIIAATNKNIREEIANGAFREDLYQRLKTFSIHLSPLRERAEDVPLLAGYFLHCLRNECGKRINRFSGQCVEFLSTREWVGNVRELKQAMERAVILTESSIITQDLFDMPDANPTVVKSLQQVEKEHMLRVLAFTAGNREKTVKILGISKQTLYNKAKEYHLPGFEKD